MANSGDLIVPPTVRQQDDRRPAKAHADGSTQGPACPEPKSYTPKRGRPTPTTVAAINQSILEAAAERFLGDGFDGSSMESIAAQAGVSKGTLYSRYADKEMLLQAVVARRIKDWSSQADQLHWTSVNGLKTRLQYYVDAMMIWHVDGEMRAFARLLAGSSGVPHEVTRVAHEFGYFSIVGTIEQIIRQSTREEGNPAHDPRWIALALTTMLSGWIHMETAIREISEDEAVAFGRRSIDLMLAARDAW